MPIVAPETFGRSDLGESFRKAKSELNRLLADDVIRSMTVLTGLPGAGKSTYAAANNSAEVVIFDSVAARPGARTALVNAAREAGKPVDLVFVDTPFEEAERRNNQRADSARVSASVMNEARDMLKTHPPLSDEGFRNVTVVRKDERVMPLKKTCSVAAFRSNIAAERAAGKPLGEAIAIARRTLEQACAKAGKPVPKAANKEADLLEAIAKSGHAPIAAAPVTEINEALARARAAINPRDYAMLHHAVKSAPVSEQPTVLERALIEKVKPSAMSTDELRSAFRKLKRRFSDNKRQGRDNEPVINASKPYVSEMKKRGIRSSGELVEACAKEAPIAGTVLTGSREQIRKGFINGTPEGGMHVHGLDRLADLTFNDGGHLHLFVMPGTREVLVTFEDGWHVHQLADGGAASEGSAHVHSVMLPTGEMLMTALGGEHTHETMLETTGFGGLHTHTIRLPDGQEIESLTVDQFIAEFTETPPRGRALPPASFFSDALNIIDDLNDEVFFLSMDLQRAEAIAAEGFDVPTEFRSDAVVIEVLPEGLIAKSADSDPFMIPPGALADADVRPGDMLDLFNTPEGASVVGFSRAAVPTSVSTLQEWSSWYETAKAISDPVPFTGPDDARVLFVASSPSSLEWARRDVLIGPDADIFEKHYLGPLGIARSEIGVGFVVPIQKNDPSTADAERWRPHLIRAMQRFTKARVVALGRVAKDALQGVDHHYMPHPTAVRRHSDTSQVDRKIRALRKALDESPLGVKNPNRPNGKPSTGGPRANLGEHQTESAKAGNVRMTVAKVLEEQRIVEGIVLDPYDVDLQEEWAPPAEVEKTAYGFVEHSRLIGFRHAVEAEGATLVSSFVEPYPSPEDRDRAHQNLPHRAFRRPFGSDVIKSGSWAAAVRLPEDLWEKILSGELSAFSIGGGSFKFDVPTTVMPEVEFIDLVPQT